MELETLAYIGEQRFHDATWKNRCQELVSDLRQVEAKVKELEEGIKLYLLSYPLASTEELRKLVSK